MITKEKILGKAIFMI